MRAVIDTNVFISGLFFGGIPQRIVQAIATGVYVPCFTSVTWKELEAVVQRKKFERERHTLSFSLEVFFDALGDHALVCKGPADFPTVIKEDPADDELLACAIACGVDYIVSGDRHLLALGSFAGVPIVKPREFVIICNDQ